MNMYIRKTISVIIIFLLGYGLWFWELRAGSGNYLSAEQAQVYVLMCAVLYIIIGMMIGLFFSECITEMHLGKKEMIITSVTLLLLSCLSTIMKRSIWVLLTYIQIGVIEKTEMFFQIMLGVWIAILMKKYIDNRKRRSTAPMIR